MFKKSNYTSTNRSKHYLKCHLIFSKSDIKLTDEEIKMIEKGKNHWDMEIFKERPRGGRVDSETMKFLIDKVIENTWEQAKIFSLTSHINSLNLKIIKIILFFMNYILKFQNTLFSN